MKNMQKSHRFLMKKRIFALFLALGVLCMLFLTACGGTPTGGTTTQKYDFDTSWEYLQNRYNFPIKLVSMTQGGKFVTDKFPDAVFRYAIKEEYKNTDVSPYPHNETEYYYYYFDIEQGGRIYVFLYPTGPEGNLIDCVYRTTSLVETDFSEIKEGSLLSEAAALEPGIDRVFAAKRERMEEKGEEFNEIYFWLLLDDGLMWLEYNKNDSGDFVLAEKCFYKDFICKRKWNQEGIWQDVSTDEEANYELNATILPQDRI